WVCLTETNVVLEKQQGGRVEQHVTFGSVQTFEFRKVVTGSQQSFFFQCTQPFWMASRFQHKRGGQVIKPFRLQQNALFPRRSPEPLHIPIVFQVPYRGNHFRIREMPIAISSLQTSSKFFRCDYSLMLRLHLFETKDVILNSFESCGRDR